MATALQDGLLRLRAEAQGGSNEAAAVLRHIARVELQNRQLLGCIRGHRRPLAVADGKIVYAQPFTGLHLDLDGMTQGEREHADVLADCEGLAYASSGKPDAPGVYPLDWGEYTATPEDW